MPFPPDSTVDTMLCDLPISMLDLVLAAVLRAGSQGCGAIRGTSKQIRDRFDANNACLVIRATGSPSTRLTMALRLVQLTPGLKRLAVNASMATRLGDEGAIVLSEWIKVNASLQHLELRNNDFTCRGGKALAEALTVNVVLKHLDLHSNNLGAEGGKALAEAVKVNSTLQHLDLTFNNLGSEGGKALAEALKTNIGLQKLDLRYNYLGSEVGKFLADALKVNATLLHLDLRDNNLGAEGGTALADALKVNASLQHLNIAFNGLSYGSSIPRSAGTLVVIV